MQMKMLVHIHVIESQCRYAPNGRKLCADLRLPAVCAPRETRRRKRTPLTNIRLFMRGRDPSVEEPGLRIGRQHCAAVRKD